MSEDERAEPERFAADILDPESKDFTEKELVTRMIEDAEAGKSTWTCWMTILERRFDGWQHRNRVASEWKPVMSNLEKKVGG